MVYDKGGGRVALLRFLVKLVLLAVVAVLAELQLLGGGALVLGCLVVAGLALTALERDDRANCHG